VGAMGGEGVVGAMDPPAVQGECFRLLVHDF
jgi:hypothetical protein